MLALLVGHGAQYGIGCVGQLGQLLAEVGGQGGFTVPLQEGLPIPTPKRTGTLQELACQR
ncbi:hypothetical protein D3C76_1013450 [compost metagenome]